MSCVGPRGHTLDERRIVQINVLIEALPSHLRTAGYAYSVSSSTHAVMQAWMGHSAQPLLPLLLPPLGLLAPQ